MRLAIFICATLSSFSSTALSQSGSIEPLYVLKNVERWVTDWEDKKTTFVDPRAANFVAYEILHFKSVYAFDYSGPRPARPIPSVMAFLNDDERMRSVIARYLDDAVEREQEFRLLEHLARQIGSSSSASGWPPKAPCNYQFHDLSDQLPSGTYRLESNGERTGRANSYRKFLILPGDHKIYDENDNENHWEFSIDGSCGSVTPFEGNANSRRGRGRER